MVGGVESLQVDKAIVWAAFRGHPTEHRRGLPGNFRGLKAVRCSSLQHRVHCLPNRGHARTRAASSCGACTSRDAQYRHGVAGRWRRLELVRGTRQRRESRRRPLVSTQLQQGKVRASVAAEGLKRIGGRLTFGQPSWEIQRSQALRASHSPEC